MKGLEFESVFSRICVIKKMYPLLILALIEISFLEKFLSIS